MGIFKRFDCWEYSFLYPYDPQLKLYAWLMNNPDFRKEGLMPRLMYTDLLDKACD